MGLSSRSSFLEHRVDAALGPCGFVDVNDLLGRRLIEKLAQVSKLNLCILKILGRDGISQLFDGGLQTRFCRTIARSTL